jgi:hypothetical protein
VPPYHWPVKPFARQHPIRGGFGDPRTLDTAQPFGWTGPGEDGAYSFHNGIDIVASPGTPVYPVVSGQVVMAEQDKIVVQTIACRSFQYIHLARAVRLGQNVTADQTVLGRIQPQFGHLHLTEIDTEPNGLRRAHNPLAAGHLEPYQVRTKPAVTGLYLDSDRFGPRPLDGLPLTPNDRLAVSAVDPPARPLPGRWLGLPQVPALVEWRLLRGSVSGPWRVVADFRQTEPAPRDFWNVYAPGTYQNAPVFEGRDYLSTPGRYLFQLGLDPSRLRAGHYQLQIRVADIRQNHSSASWPIQIARR